MKNNIAYKKDDIVCIKESYQSPFGKVSTKIKDIVPLKVVDVLPDRDFENRIGKIGCANQYRLENCITGNTFLLYQYELTFWSEMKPKVIKHMTEYIEKLETI